MFRQFIKKIIVFILTGAFWLAGCRKDPEVLQQEDSLLSFYNASEQLLMDMRRTTNPVTVVPILINTSETGEVTNLSPKFEGITARQLAYPAIGTGTLPWAEFMQVMPGTQTISFVGMQEDGDTTLLSQMQVDTRTSARGRLFLSDSLGIYHTFYLQDEGRAEARQVRLRITHLGPDAGALQLAINNEQVPLARPLLYNSATDMMTWDIPQGKTDTLLRLQVIDSGEEVLGRVNLPLKPGETAHVVIYGYYNNASYEDPVTGETVNVSANFRVHAFRYN